MIRRKVLSWPRGCFLIDVPGPGDLTVEGDTKDTQYMIHRDGRLAARALRDRKHLCGTYQLEVHDDADAVLMISCLFAIARVCSRSRNDD